MGTTENKKQEQPIQRIDIVAFANLLRKRSPAVARFKIDRYTQDVPAMLRECYRFQVENRGYSYQEDEATRQHLTMAARWRKHETGVIHVRNTRMRKDNISACNFPANKYDLP